jgi:hypothetical protein
VRLGSAGSLIPGRRTVGVGMSFSGMLVDALLAATIFSFLEPPAAATASPSPPLAGAFTFLVFLLVALGDFACGRLSGFFNRTGFSSHPGWRNQFIRLQWPRVFFCGRLSRGLNDPGSGYDLVQAFNILLLLEQKIGDIEEGVSL